MSIVDGTERRKITLDQIEARMVDPTIIRKMVKGYFARVDEPPPTVEDHTLTISCVDSRVPPSKVLGLEHGEAYSVQTVANVVPRLNLDVSYDEQPIEVAAALQYAVGHKGVNRIIVMGHTNCGGAEARLLQHTSLPNVNHWMSHICIDHPPSPGLLTALREDPSPLAYQALTQRVEELCLKTSIRNVKAMPFIKDAIEKAGLSIASMICDIREGRLKFSYGNRAAGQAITDILDRFQSFKLEAWGPDGYMHDLAANGQHPKALILTGMSPYAAPEVVFGIEPGDAFLHRRIGGHYHHERTPGGATATLEFAVAAKEVPSLIFVGHRNDVNRDYAQGLLDRYDLVTGFMEKCLPDLREWRDSGMDPANIHEKSMISTYFNARKHPAVKEAMKAGKLSVAALLVDHERKTMEFYDPQTNEFMEVVPPAL